MFRAEVSGLAKSVFLLFRAVRRSLFRTFLSVSAVLGGIWSYPGSEVQVA